MNWKNWLKGLALVVGTASVSAAVQVVNNRTTSKSAPPITGGSIGITAGVAAIGALLAYLTQSPLDPNAK
jgi:hypothetical protein